MLGDIERIAKHIEQSLWLADGLPRDVRYDCLKDSLHRVVFEVEQLAKQDKRAAL